MARIRYKEAARVDVKKGRPSLGNKPDKDELKKLYVKELKSIREIAEGLGCSKDMVYRALKEYKIETRPDHKRSKLRHYNKSCLKKLVEEKGITNTANLLAVNKSTLKKYIA